MSKTLTQTVSFAAPAAKLYKLFLDAELYAKATGKKATMTAEVGSKFTVGNKYARGTVIHLAKNSMIVQTWRAADWEKGESDSVLVLLFEETAKGTDLHVTQANVPEGRLDGVKASWKETFEAIKASFKAAEAPAAPKAVAKKPGRPATKATETRAAEPAKSAAPKKRGRKPLAKQAGVKS